MKQSPAAARVLVASDDLQDAQQIVRQLAILFENVRASTNADAAVAECDSFAPEVLVLAFHSIEKAQRYYLGLYRLGSNAVRQAHRTVLLCTKDEVAPAFELCRKEYFDDYVLYWPHSYDGSRLAMSIWGAARQLGASPSFAPHTADLLTHARHLADLEGVVADKTVGSTAELRARMEPSLQGTRPLADAVRALKPVVMVIDDDEFSRQLARQAIDAHRWEVVLAVDGQDAFAQLRSVRPDLILMDIRLPGMDGLSLTRSLKATPHLAGIPIIMMTGDSRRETLTASLEAGAVAFVVKPVERQALEEKFGKLMPR